MIKEPIKIKELNSIERINSFKEVVLGYTEREAFKEAQRCLQCKNPPCILGCPVQINIKKFIYYITQKKYKEAYLVIKEKNSFPSILGRVCPAEYHCRKRCVLNNNKLPFASREAINIHFLERFIGDYGRKHFNFKHKFQEMRSEFKNKKVAIVGSGPAGLGVAAQLAKHRVKVVIFESLHKAGGVLRYGIPSFRLPPNVVDFEVEELKKLKVKIITNFIVGKTKTLKELFKEGYDCVFLGLGAGVPNFLGIRGENLCNIYSANEFLTRVNLMQAYRFPYYHTPVNIGRKVIVIGGGNTAIDAARVALRLQRKSGFLPNTLILYRRTELEMPARRFEIEHAKEEGVKFEFLVQPKEFIGDENGFVKGIRCLKCYLGKEDSTGRRKPIPIKGSDFKIDCDLVIVAIGFKANRILSNTIPDLKTDTNGNIIVSPHNMQTSIKGVFAGGDIVGGEGTVIEAMGMAKKAARGIIEYLFKNK
jgi:glutamate synthase (NADPH/NADH) small chain